MPAIVAFFVRQLLIIGVQLGLFAFIDRLIVPLLNRAIVAIMGQFGVNEETAKDIMANEVITTAESLGLVVALSKAKLPLKVADTLNFAKKGVKQRVLSLQEKTELKAIEELGTSLKVTEYEKEKNLVKKAILLKHPVSQKLIQEFKFEALVADITTKTTSTLGGTLGKGILTLTAGLFAWNVLTDWIWIGSSLGFLPGEAQKDIQKRALSIIDLIDAPKSIIYSAEKVKRSLSQQERELIADTADEAERQINDLARVYSSKFVAFGRADVRDEMNRAISRLELQLLALRQMAGLVPRQPIKIDEISAVVKTVYDGDTVLLDNGETVRLVGIDAPESTTEAGEKAKKFLKEKIEGQTVTVKSDPTAMTDIYGRRLGVIEFGGENINIEMLRAKHAIYYEYAPNALVFKKQWVAAEKEVTGITAPAATFKIFTGVIQQGTLGAPVQMVTRETDLISNHDQLQIAAQVNIGQFWQGLSGRILYELKIVPTVINKDGTRRRGETHQVIVGTTVTGRPKTKTVTNKFAVVDIYVWTARKVRTKIDQIILGPVDALNFRPTQIELGAFSDTLPQIVLTNNTNEIQTLVTQTPTNIVESAAPPPAPTPAPVVAEIRPTPPPPAPTPAPAAPIVEPPAAVPIAPTAPAAVPIAPTVAIPHSINPNRCVAQSVAEFFDPAKVQFPSITTRAQHYEQYGFGPAAWYTGTAEQNARLLAAYKKQIGCG